MSDVALCPFCGDKFCHAEQLADSAVWGVHCPNGMCPSFGNWLVRGFSEEEAVSLFNTRHADPRIAFLEAELTECRAQATSFTARLENHDAEPPTVSYQHLETADLISQAGDLRHQMFRAGECGYVISKTRHLCTLAGSMLSALTTRLATGASLEAENAELLAECGPYVQKNIDDRRALGLPVYGQEAFLAKIAKVTEQEKYDVRSS